MHLHLDVTETADLVDMVSHYKLCTQWYDNEVERSRQNQGASSKAHLDGIGRCRALADQITARHEAAK